MIRVFKNVNRFASGLACLMLLLFLHARVGAQTIYTTISSADAFLATGSPTNPEGTNLTALNFGAVGALDVAPTSSSAGEFQTVLRFNLGGATNLFNAAYGTNNWIISGISLELTGNFGATGEKPFNGIFPPVSGGSFVIEWLSNDGWLEGTGTPIMPTMDGVTYNSIPSLLSGMSSILSTNTYVPPGDNIPVSYPLPLDTNLVSDASLGGDVSFLLYAADNQIGYLFNSHDYGRNNEPKIHVTAIQAPPRILSASMTNNAFYLTGQGVAGHLYHIVAVTNLPAAGWQSIGAVTANNSGLVQFEDHDVPNHAERFYRLEY
jgi:hypothetical protein